MTESNLDISFKLVSASDIQSAFELEIAGFPEDEAATLPTLQYRQSVAPSLFFGAYKGSKLIGFVCSTLSPLTTLTHESMTNHVPNSPFVGIHSVCMSKDYRRKGIAVSLLKEYITILRRDKYQGVRLISHEELIPLYTKAGFNLVGESSVIHGARPWYELNLELSTTSTVAKDVEKVETAAAVVAVVEERNPGKPFESFSGMNQLLDKDSKNIGNLYCPRGECRCLLLKAGVGKLVRGNNVDFQLPALPHLTSDSTPISSSTEYWSVPSPLSFENIGFSRNALPPTSSSTTLTSTASPPVANIKYLVCADCDHGPLGWHDTEGRDLGLEVEAENEGKAGELRKGREFLLDVSRVRYKV